MLLQLWYRFLDRQRIRRRLEEIRRWCDTQHASKSVAEQEEASNER